MAVLRRDDRWLIRFTDGELNAIYDALENTERVPNQDTLESVLDKITPSRPGDPAPKGAVQEEG